MAEMGGHTQGVSADKVCEVRHTLHGTKTSCHFALPPIRDSLGLCRTGPGDRGCMFQTVTLAFVLSLSAARLRISARTQAV